MLSSFLPYPFHVLQGISTQMPYFKEIKFFCLWHFSLPFFYSLLLSLLLFSLLSGNDISVSHYYWKAPPNIWEKKEQKPKNNHSTWHNVFYHLSQLKLWKSCSRRQKNFCMFQIFSISVLHRAIRDRIREQIVTQKSAAINDTWPHWQSWI